MAKVKVTQVKSSIKKPSRQKLTLQALGLRKIGGSVEVELNPAMEGMIRKVNHLVTIENI